MGEGDGMRMCLRVYEGIWGCAEWVLVCNNSSGTRRCVGAWVCVGAHVCSGGGVEVIARVSKCMGQCLCAGVFVVSVCNGVCV